MVTDEALPQPISARARITDLLARHHKRTLAQDETTLKSQERQRLILKRIPDAIEELFEPPSHPLLSETDRRQEDIARGAGLAQFLEDVGKGLYKIRQTQTGSCIIVGE